MILKKTSFRHDSPTRFRSGRYLKSEKSTVKGVLSFSADELEIVTPSGDTDSHNVDLAIQPRLHMLTNVRKIIQTFQIILMQLKVIFW